MKAIVAVLLLQVGLVGAENEVAPDSEGPATLTVWHREVVTFRATVAGMTPAERRSEAAERIRKLADFSIYEPIEKRSVSAGDLTGVAFYIDDQRLFMLFQEDVNPTTGGNFDDLSARSLKQLEELRSAWLEQRNGGVVLRGVGLSLVATLIFAFALFLLNRLGRFVRRRFVRRTAKFRQLKRGDFDLRPVLLQLGRRLVGLVVAGVGFMVGYLWLTFALSQFPYTAPWAETLGRQLGSLSERLLDSILSGLPGLMVVILIFFITRGAVRVVDQLLASLERSEDEGEILGRDTAKATRRIAGLCIWISGIIIAYPYIPGSDSPAFKGIGVLLGLMVSFGSSGFVNQLMSGFVVLYSGAVRSGEFIRSGGIEGTVAEIGLLSTKIRTPKQEFVSIPNALLISRETLNYTRQNESGRCELSTAVTIGYDAPWRQVQQLLLDAAGKTPGIRTDPKPSVLQTALSDFYVEYELRFVPGKPEQKGRILSDLHARIQDAFHGAGLQIMSPHFMSQPETAVLPQGGNDSADPC